ncbi:MAG: polysaccharide biosynthesis protein [Rhodobacteraceae bacterium]|nr:polysaccharide biosynthesis protein [Paracoccaceae bacterium]
MPDDPAGEAGGSPPDRADDDLGPSTSSWYRGRSVLITGGGGSIGSALALRLVRLAPSRIVLLDHAEGALFSAGRALAAAAPSSLRVETVLGSVCDGRPVARALGWGADIVFHAAACKHVPLVEANVAVGVATNVFGTLGLLRQAREAGVGRFVLVSTDKAVRPAGAMGATKRLAELAAMDLARRPGAPRTAVVRFGNVIGSSGSVVPLLRDQIARGGPVTVSHPRAERYFMTMREATALLLHAGSRMSGGETFMRDMGPPVRILDLAERLIEEAGHGAPGSPKARPAITFTGLRPGEKLCEDLPDWPGEPVEGAAGLRRAFEPVPSEIEVAAMLRLLRERLDAGEEEALRATCLALAGRHWAEGARTPAVAQ